MELETLGTAVVPGWEDQPWYSYLRHVHRSAASTPGPLSWSKQSPAMEGSVPHGADPHGVGKWAFRAFLVDNRGTGGRTVDSAEGCG